MPITTPISLPRLTEKEMRELDYEIMSHVFAAQRDLGWICDETVYKADLASRLIAAHLKPVRREVPVRVSFQSFTKTYELDLVVADRTIYELKTVTALAPSHEAQLL